MKLKLYKKFKNFICFWKIFRDFPSIYNHIIFYVSIIYKIFNKFHIKILIIFLFLYLNPSIYFYKINLSILPPQHDDTIFISLFSLLYKTIYAFNLILISCLHLFFLYITSYFHYFNFSIFLFLFSTTPFPPSPPHSILFLFYFSIFFNLFLCDIFSFLQSHCI